MLKNKSLPFLAFLQVTGLVAYVIFLSLFFNFITPNFSNTTAEFYAPIIMLLLFVFSAVISASLILGRAGMLFWEKQYKEAFTLIARTIGWGLLYIVAFVFVMPLS